MEKAVILSPLKGINTNEDIRQLISAGIVSSSQLRSQQLSDFWWHADPEIQNLFILMLYRLFGPIRDKAVWNHTVVAQNRD
jgi:hypothetical protein